MPPYVVMGFAQTRRRQFAEALVNAERAHALGAWDPVVMGLFGAALVNTGDRERAQQILAPLGDGSAPGTSLGLGVFQLLLGDVELGADYMTRVIDERYPGILFFVNGALGAPLRASTRWPAMRRMLNLPEGAG